MWKIVLWAGGLAGTLDIISAFTFFGARGVQPFRILQTIASGVLGAASYRGGVATAMLGGALHYLIACTAAALYCMASLKLPALNRRPILFGMLYGGAVYAFMNAIVVPLSAVPRAAAGPKLSNVIFGVLAVVLLVGVPIALVCCQSSLRNRAQQTRPKRPSPLSSSFV